MIDPDNDRAASAPVPQNFDARSQAFGSMPARNPDAPEGTFIQPKITGYRQLSTEEVALMNEAKALGTQFEDLIARLRRYHQVQWDEAVTRQLADNSVELHRLRDAEPERWLAMGRTDIQTGVMKIVRSIAQPAS